MRGGYGAKDEENDEASGSCGGDLGGVGVVGNKYSGDVAAVAAVGNHNCWSRRCYFPA